MGTGSGRARLGRQLLVEFAQLDRDQRDRRSEFADRVRALRAPRAQGHPEATGDRMTRNQRNTQLDPMTDPPTRTTIASSRSTSSSGASAEQSGITVKNIGEAPATNVRLEIVVPVGVGILPRLELPYKPQRTESLAERIRPFSLRTPKLPWANLTEQPDDRLPIDIDCQDLQPGRRVWTDNL